MNCAFIHDPQKNAWMQFKHPFAVLEAKSLSDVLPVLREVQRLVSHGGRYAAGWISYEAAPSFDPALRTCPATSFPLVYFGIFGPPALLTTLPLSKKKQANPKWHPSVNKSEYWNAVSNIKQNIASGDTYQVNYTFRQRGHFCGDPWIFFLNTCHESRYGAFIDADKYAVCSASPELFFLLDGDRIISKPMKGTAPRGMTITDDRENSLLLHHSEKNRAENVMIVDMIRNDLGRVAQYGSVIVTHLYDIEKYPTVLQMTSTIEARTSSALPEILTALFPCASVTGAPKAKTMEIISAMETSPRNIYTGAIGYFGPQRLAQFNVAIRTTLIDKASSLAEYGVGGGIIWDSTADDEYRECLIKSKTILSPVSRKSFNLLETMLWTPENGFFLEMRHLSRLHDSALYFGYFYDENAIKIKLYATVKSLTSGPHRVRLLLSKDGTVECHATLLEPLVGRPLKVRLSKDAVHSDNRFLFHKTTLREPYEKAKAMFPDADDVLLHNESGEATESCIANLVILQKGRMITPPVRCGLLNGTYRSELLEKGEIVEDRITLSELKNAEKIFLINSVRKWHEAILDAEDRR